MPKDELLFERPEFNKASRAAQVALGLGALSSRLALENRTRIEHPGGRAENVAEHSFALVKVAPELATLLYPELDENLVARFASVHDDVEAYVGDTATDIITEEGLKEKREREARGIQKLKEEYADLPSYIRLIGEYEAQVVPEARFVRVVDKLMTVLAHFPNEGKVMKETTLYDVRDPSRRSSKVAKMMEEYPEFETVIALREELIKLIIDTFLEND